MICPKCGNGELDASGRCPGCGFEATIEVAPPAEPAPADLGPSHVGAIPIDFSGPSGNGSAEIPAWRHELSRRLQEIKKKRETGGPLDAAALEPLLPFSQPEPPSVEPKPPAPESVSRKRPARPRPPQVPQEPLRATPPAQAEVPAEVAAGANSPLRLVQPPGPSGETGAQAPEPLLRRSPHAAGEYDTITDLIDNVTGRAAAPAEVRPRIVAPVSGPDRPGEGKLILLSRTLAGLVDLLIVVLCAGAFIIAADFFSGIDVLDTISLVHYGILLLAVYLLYSVFFLGAAGQTIGMMITDLKVVQAESRRPAVGSLLLRCAAYPLCVLAFGIGVAWAVFDRESLCLHDRLSGTHVARL
jgi:uncharacterized RDD family membrane protein YckC